MMVEVVVWKKFLDDLFSPPLLESLFAPWPAKRQVSINQDFTVTDQHKLVEEVGGEAEGEQSLSSENHVMAPAKRRSAGFVKKESDPIVFLKSAMRTRGSGRASREANAVQWRTFGFDVIVL